MAQAEKPYKLEPQVVDKLLDSLAKDDDFRDRFVKDFRGAIESLGHKPPKAQEGKKAICPDCKGPKRLADKAVIAASLKTLRSSLSAGMAFTINVLDDKSPHWPKS